MKELKNILWILINYVVCIGLYSLITLLFFHKFFSEKEIILFYIALFLISKFINTLKELEEEITKLQKGKGDEK